MTTKAALITGASSGIGKEFARQLAANSKLDLILSARREAELEQLAEECRSSNGSTRDIMVIPADLSLEEDRHRLCARIDHSGRQVEMLVNNAGFGSLGEFAQSSLEWELGMIEVNCKAPVHLCHHFLPMMRERKSGSIINVASTTSFQPLPLMATYAATKALLVSFSQALAVECAADGVHVLALCPGPTDTSFNDAAGLPGRISCLSPMGVEPVVRQALEGVLKRRRLVVNGLLNRVLSLVPRLLPQQTSAAVAKAMLRTEDRRQ